MAVEVVTEEIEQPQVVETPVVEGDADDRAMAEAEAELAAENAANAGEGEGEQAAEGDAVVETQPVAEQPRAPIMIPKERLDHESGKRRQAEDELLVERGRRQVLEALVTGGKPAAAVVEQPKTPAEQIKDLRAAQLENAKLYNEGEIDIIEFETRRIAADDQIADIRSQAAVHVATDRATAPANSEWLAAQTAEIEQAHPVLGYVKETEMKNLAELAKSEMEEAGAPFNARSRESILELRQRTAELADHTFGHRVPAAQPAAAAPARITPKPAVTAAQRGAKAALAGRVAPDITKVGTAASAAPLTEARVASMSDAEMDQLSDAELDALERRQMAG
jgi:hypothetical protein